MKFYRPTWAEIDLGALRHNVQRVKAAVGPASKIMVVVKANAYGHGLVEVSRVLSKENIDYLGVATADEAIALRENRIKNPVLILSSILKDEIYPCLANDITLTVGDLRLAHEVDAVAKSMRKKACAHLKIDTGMGRIGVWHEEAFDFVREASKLKNMTLEGIYTHFSSPGRDKFFTKYQLDSFKNLVDRLAEKKIIFPLVHVSSSISLTMFNNDFLNLARPGLVIYGMSPKKGMEEELGIRPVLSLKTKIVFLKGTPPGRSISYGRTYITEKHTKIATLPIGYGDGYGRILSNKAQVLVRGLRAPVVGKVTMDQTMIDVGHVEAAAVGDEVVLIGRQGSEEIRTEELAKLSGTIPYEIACSLASRVPRIYIDKKRFD